MRNDKNLATLLRKQGKSYNTIQRELRIPKSTLSDWFSELKWSVRLAKTLNKNLSPLIKIAQGKRWDAWRKQFQEEAIKEFPLLIQNPLFVAGICLYWGEGDNKPKNSVVRLVNTDPRMVKLFCKFLRDVLKVDPKRMRAALVLYNDLSDEQCKPFWSEVSGIPINQFHKTQFIKGKHPTRRTTYGMCTIYGRSKGLKEKIFTWTNLLYKQFQA